MSRMHPPSILPTIAAAASAASAGLPDDAEAVSGSTRSHGVSGGTPSWPLLPSLCAIV